MTQIEGAANFPVFPLKPFHFFFNWKKSIKNVSVKYLEIVKAPALISHRFLLTAPYNFRTNPNESNQDKKKRVSKTNLFLRLQHPFYSMQLREEDSSSLFPRTRMSREVGQ
jgi:hypothetical protein